MPLVNVLLAVLVLRFDSSHPNGGKIARLPKESVSRFTRSNRLIPSNTGCLSPDTFQFIMREFKTQWLLMHEGRVCIILMDNLGIYHQPQLIIDMSKEKIYMFFFVEYTSHWSQPLDSFPFANWKANLAKLTMEKD